MLTTKSTTLESVVQFDDTSYGSRGCKGRRTMSFEAYILKIKEHILARRKLNDIALPSRQIQYGYFV